MTDSSTAQPTQPEGSPIWVICIVCGLILSVAIIIEVVHYTKIYVKERKAQKLESPVVKN